MRRSLKGNLILSYLGVALLTVLVVSILIRLTSGQSLMNLVVEQQTARLKESVETYYTNNGTLTGFFEDYMVSSMEPHPLDMVPPAPPNEEREIRGLNGLVDADQLAVIPFAEYQVGDSVARDQMKHAVAVEVDGETIAWILPDTKYQFALNAEEELFLTHQPGNRPGCPGGDAGGGDYRVPARRQAYQAYSTPYQRFP